MIAYQRPEKLIKKEELTEQEALAIAEFSGYVTKNVSVSIFDPVTKSPLKINEVGLIYCKSPSVTNGYLNSDAKNLNANLMTVTDDDGKLFLFN